MTALILKGRLLNALRSVAVSPKGLRIGAFPKSMVVLVQMGLVEERPLKPTAKRTGWFLTARGREAVREHGLGEGEERSEWTQKTSGSQI